jgi:hypothetical protein
VSRKLLYLHFGDRDGLVVAAALDLVEREFLRKDGFSLEVPFNWGVQVAGQERRFATVRQRIEAKKVQQALSTLPLKQADIAAMGRRSDYIQNILSTTGTTSSGQPPTTGTGWQT